jgi:DivIVA domain-containing protein
MWVWVIVIVALTGGVVVVAVGRGGSMSEVYDDRPDVTVPSGRPLTSDDLRDVQFSTAVRGYRMDEVDALLARVRGDLIARESRLDDEDVRVVDAVETAASPAPPAEPASTAESTDPVDRPEPPATGRRVRDRLAPPADDEPR